MLCDNLNLPFRDESLDAVLSVAVIHHVATAERRVRALRELARVVRVGGRVMISVWAMEQRHRKVTTNIFNISDFLSSAMTIIIIKTKFSTITTIIIITFRAISETGLNQSCLLWNTDLKLPNSTPFPFT
jgi:ubiquinone/menaquinone biosynthesis C-methylase UbiE